MLHPGFSSSMRRSRTGTWAIVQAMVALQITAGSDFLMEGAVHGCERTPR
jgi:hypothetical protein